MSFTVMRFKDGKPAPIKLSIWDALKGAPPRKPKPKLASKSSETATVDDKDQKSNDGKAVEPKPDTQSKPDTTQTEAKANDKKADEKDQDQKSKKDGDEKKQGGSHSTRDQESYSKDDDEKIIELKKAGKSWKEILAAINKESKSQLQEHWKTINPDNKDSDKKNTDSKGEAKKDDEGTAKEDSKKKGGKQKDKPNDAKDKNGKNAETKGDSSMLKGWSDRYDRQKWIAAASRHFDLTGQRITAATAKKLAEGK